MGIKRVLGHWLVGAPLAIGLMAAASAAPRPTSVAPPASDPLRTALSGPTENPDKSLDPAALAAFVDGVVQSQMADRGIAGVTVAVVDRNGPLLLKGYGVASLNPRLQVDPNRTLFRLGSISKTFTYVATMQLVAAGKLDLDAPVDRYLPPSLKTDTGRYPPIRLWHLMTHTAGFEDASLGAHLFYDDAAKVQTLDAWLAKYRPQRVRSPAVHADYSNYSVALLGAIVQQVSGEPFDTYVERHILTPLGMRHTTFRDPPSKSAADPTATEAWSEGFKYEQGGFARENLAYIANIAPAGGGSSTAADMARWMRMFLNQGELDGVQVLDPITFREMVTPTWSNAPAVHAIAHGFFVGRYGKYRSLEHAGDTLWFHSNMVLLPQAGIGVFVATNTATDSIFPELLPGLIFDHFLSAARPLPPPVPAENFAKSGQRYAGTWLSERRNYSTLEKGLTLSVAKTSITQDGYLVLSGGGESRRYVLQAPDVFRSLDNSDRIQFLRDSHGRITGLASAYGHIVYDRASWFDDPSTVFAALAALALVCLGALIGAWGRRASKARTGAPSRTLLAAVFAWVVFFVIAAVAAATLSSEGEAILFDYPSPLVWLVVIVAYAASVLSILALLFLPRVWRTRDWSLWRKFRHALIILLMLFVVALLIEWNVLLAPLATS